MRPLLLLLFPLLLALGACGTAQTSASFTLPASAGGRLCAHQCGEAEDYCQQSCKIQQRQCVMKVQTTAMQDYDAYTRDQFARHEELELNPSDFERQQPCTDAEKSCIADCDKPYRSCYEDCGGQVTVETSCQFLCF